MKKVVLTYRLSDDAMGLLKDKVDLWVTNNGKLDEQSEALEDAEGVIVRTGSIGRKAIMAAKKLKVISRTGVGVDTIDVKAATEMGIPVVFTPGVNTRSVAEYTLSMIFAASRDLNAYNSRIRDGEYIGLRDRGNAFVLLGKTVGIIGFGNIGREVAKLCSAIGMKVLIYDHHASSKASQTLEYDFSNSLEELLACSDVVTIHVPLTPMTRELIGRRELDMMKKSSILVNSSRGNIVDEEALFNALKDNKIGGAALDVFSSEPPEKDNPLFKLDNIILTPHVASLTKESFSTVCTMAVEGLLDILNGEKWPHVVNKEAYDHPRWKK